MKRLWWLWLLLGVPAAAQTNCNDGAGTLVPDPPPLTHEEIIQRFAANEAAFKQARNAYTYTQDISIQTIRRGGFQQLAITGEYRMVSDVSFDDHGKLLERVTYAPRNTLRTIQITREDLDDIHSMADFVFTPSELTQYNVRYAGHQHVDELDTYAFDVGPKRLAKDHRYFEGRIWVDAQDFAIVKTCGKRIPDRHEKRYENISPTFVTYREQVDGQYWFATYSRSDDVLYFGRARTELREVIKYTRYQRVTAH